MRVLHVGDAAAVGRIISKYMNRIFKTKSDVVQRKIFDRDNMTAAYGGKLWDCGAKTFALKCLWEARRFDLIHVHSLDKLIPFLRLLYPRKPIVLHYHGTDIRGKWSLKKKYWSKANLIFYSTLDLLDDETPADAVYMPNPVDTEIFYPSEVKPKPKSAFHFSYNADDLAKGYAEKHGLELTIHDWRKDGRIPHLKIPEILRQYEYYIDVKRSRDGNLLKIPLSKTALEALACGLKVITWDGKIVKVLPLENYPENVAKKTFEMYLKLIEKQ